MGRFLILAGFLVVIIGCLIQFKVPMPWIASWIGKLPGDIVIKKEHATIYFPITTSILFSVILSLIFSLFRK